MNIDFKCKLDHEKWNGRITKISEFGSLYELKIESRSGFIVIIGKTEYGNFACIPAYDAGCHLSSLKDKFWNTERLSSIMNVVDGVTVAAALEVVADYINLE